MYLGLNTYKPLIVGFCAVFSSFFVSLYQNKKSPSLDTYVISFFLALITALIISIGVEAIEPYLSNIQPFLLNIAPYFSDIINHLADVSQDLTLIWAVLLQIMFISDKLTLSDSLLRNETGPGTSNTTNSRGGAGGSGSSNSERERTNLAPYISPPTTPNRLPGIRSLGLPEPTNSSEALPYDNQREVMTPEMFTSYQAMCSNMNYTQADLANANYRLFATCLLAECQNISSTNGNQPVRLRHSNIVIGSFAHGMLMQVFPQQPFNPHYAWPQARGPGHTLRSGKPGDLILWSPNYTGRNTEIGISRINAIRNHT